MDVTTVSIQEYAAEHQPWFEKLNRDWIEKFFWMEPIDVEVLSYPEKYIIEKGGSILMARCNGEIAGTVALKFVKPGMYEFTKMAVDEKFQGKKIGLLLAEAAILKARQQNARSIILYSNTILTAAISLYRKLGFKEIPLDGPYKRSNIKMELILDIRMVHADGSHVALLSKLGSETFSETFAQYNNPLDFNEYLQKSFNPAQIEKEIREPGSLYILAKVDDEFAGYARLRETAELEQTFPGKKTIELQRIYSHSRFLGKGVGKALLLYCLEVAKERACDILWLGVWEHNHNAIQFYKHFGFKAFDSHVFMLGSDAQTDILMKNHLTV